MKKSDFLAHSALQMGNYIVKSHNNGGLTEVSQSATFIIPLATIMLRMTAFFWVLMQTPACHCNLHPKMSEFLAFLKREKNV